MTVAGGEDSELEDAGKRRSDWKVLKDLVDIYDILYEPRYMITTTPTVTPQHNYFSARR